MTDWIDRLQLAPHPEGGYFRRIHTDSLAVETADGERQRLSSIHYLLTRDQPVGCLHSNRSTILHYLQHGGPVDYCLLSPAGELREVRLGYAEGQALFLPVAPGVWKASRLADGADHALVAEVVVPGFDPADHVYMTAEMLAEFPQHATRLKTLLRKPD